MFILNQETVKKIIPAAKMPLVINAVERGFSDYAQGYIQMPPKQYLNFPEYSGDLRIMPAYSSKLKIAGTKIVNVHPKNPKKMGLPTVMAAILLNASRDGTPLALIEASWLTGMRTGAAGAIAAKYAARKNAETLGVIGAGMQAFFQITAITKVRRLKEIAVCDVSKDNFPKLSTALRTLNIKIKMATAQEAAQKDILVTTTPVTMPIIQNGWIKSGTHINAIGADAAGKEELDPLILQRAKIIIDNWEQASHSGEINVPFAKGLLTRENIYAELGEIVVGKKDGRANEQEVTVFDSTGLALQDLYTADLVYKAAKKLGLKEVRLF